MTTIRILLGLLLAAGVTLADDKKEAKAPDLTGTWKISGGKKAGAEVSDMGKEGVYVITKDTITIKAGEMDLFVMKYTVDAKASPAAIDMEITKGPGAEGAEKPKAKGIVEVKDDEMKICYHPMGGDRPTKFDGAEPNYYFTLKKQKAEKK